MIMKNITASLILLLYGFILPVVPSAVPALEKKDADSRSYYSPTVSKYKAYKYKTFLPTLIVYEDDAFMCADENTRSFECSGSGGPGMCCEGLVCHEHQTWKCVQEQHKTCAGKFSFATECGSDYKQASPKCCPGLSCLGKKCVEPVEACARENKQSIYCGAREGRDVCCSELVCHKYQYWRCVTEDKKECSGDGTFSQECGSNFSHASPTCCDGLVCKNKKCVSPR